MLAYDHLFLGKRGRQAPKPRYVGSSGGGSVGNTLAALRLLGHQPTIFGVIGNDAIGQLLKQDLDLFGVETRFVAVRGRMPELRRTRQFSHLILEGDDHTFKDRCLTCQTTFERDVQVSGSLITKELKAVAAKAQIAHFDRANAATIALAEKCKNGGGAVSYDYAYEATKGGSRASSAMLAIADLVKVTHEVAAKRYGKSLEDILRGWQKDFSTRFLLVTRGAEGVAGYGETPEGRVVFGLPAVRLENPFDTAGAGDWIAATAVDQLLALRVPGNEKELAFRINRGQALAALSCTLYGARSLQRVFLKEALGAREIIRRADAILEAGVAANSISPTLGLPPAIDYYRFQSAQMCRVCGTTPSRMPSKRDEVPPQSLYLKELSRGPPAMTQAYEVGLANAPSTHPPTLFVGSGGSFVAGVYGEQALLQILGVPAKALTPFEFAKLPKLEGSRIVFLSYGGKNSDILRAARHASRLQARDVIVVTSSPGSPLGQIASSSNWRVIKLMSEARGFVSTVGMLSMVAALYGAIAPDATRSRGFFEEESLYRLFSKAARQAREKVSLIRVPVAGMHLIALGNGMGWPPVVDLESKIVEGGVCTIEVSELKNYTHGRYINALHHRRNRHFVIFQTPEEQELVQYLRKKLSRFFGMTFVETHHTGPLGCLELLIEAMFIAAYLARKAGRDLSRPRFPREARGLYGWTPAPTREAV